jgi:hypothetical protein
MSLDTSTEILWRTFSCCAGDVLGAMFVIVKDVLRFVSRYFLYHSRMTSSLSGAGHAYGGAVITDRQTIESSRSCIWRHWHPMGARRSRMCFIALIRIPTLCNSPEKIIIRVMQELELTETKVAQECCPACNLLKGAITSRGRRSA